MEIPIKARVQCTDGPGGEVTHVIVHPATKRVTRVVVKEARSPHVERVVPFRYVEDAIVDQIRLRCSRQELSKMQTFLRTESIETTLWWHGRGPAEFEEVKRENIPDDELAMDANTPVKATDGDAGRIEKLRVDRASGSIIRLTLQEGRPWSPKQVTILRSEIDCFTDRAVYLKINRAAIEALLNR